MPNKETLSFSCPCERAHTFQKTYLVVGEGNTTVQERCPNPQCPGKNPLLSLPIPFRLERDEDALKGSGIVIMNDTPIP